MLHWVCLNMFLWSFANTCLGKILRNKIAGDEGCVDFFFLTVTHKLRLWLFFLYHSQIKNVEAAVFPGNQFVFKHSYTQTHERKPRSSLFTTSSSEGGSFDIICGTHWVLENTQWAPQQRRWQIQRKWNFLWGRKKIIKWVKSFFFLLSPSFLYFVTCVVIPGLEYPFITKSYSG